MSEQRAAASGALPQEARFNVLMTEMMSAVNYTDPSSLLEAARKIEQVLQPYMSAQGDHKRRELGAIMDHQRRLSETSRKLREEAQRLQKREDFAEFLTANATRIEGGGGPTVPDR